MKKLSFSVRDFLKDMAGNLGFVAAATLPVLIGATGLAMDYMKMVNEQQVLQNALDAAAVSAAASLVAGHHDATTVQDYAYNLVIATAGNSLDATEKAELKKNLAVTVKSTSTSGKKTYDIKLTGRFNVALTPFSRLFGYSKRPVAGISTTQSEYASQNALSMYMVLDRSGSMSFVTSSVDATKNSCPNYTASNWGWYPDLWSTSPCHVTKIKALKTAAATLFDELDALEHKDSKDSIIRVGGVSFTDSMQSPTSTAWGTSAIRTYVSNIPRYPTGGTDMTDGMAEALNSLTASSETAAHTAKGNTTFSKFIVLMTDGENTGASSIWNPALDTETLATCTSARSAGITIYAVAFMAPSNGEALLKSCAGLSSNFYSANDIASLVKAFKDIGTKAVAKATRIVN